MCVRLHVRAFGHVRHRTCVRVCEGVHGCALGEKACGAHVRTHVRTCVHASEGAHVLV